jgi:heptosyltransferase-1
LIAKTARPAMLVGFGRQSAREEAAAWFYSRTIEPAAAHIVDRNMELAAFAAMSVDPQAARDAFDGPREFPLPAGHPEGSLPSGPFVLASPFAGWGSKQWPLEYWSELAKRVDVPLVVNGPPPAARLLSEVRGAQVHVSGLQGLIDATRRAAAVLGLDSGPLHLAAALEKPGVALFGPTDPARNGPYGNSIRVLRDPEAITAYRARGDYRRGDQPDPSMCALKPPMVAEALRNVCDATRKGSA